MCWTMHRDDRGGRIAGFEPSFVPVPTIAWLTRHLWRECLFNAPRRQGFRGCFTPSEHVAGLVPWVNIELTKNVAEIGQLRCCVPPGEA